MGNQWTLQDAKNKFSAVVEAAQKGEPQHVTKRGIEAVVVLSAENYRRLMEMEEKQKPGMDFVEFLFSAPKLPEGMDDFLDFENRPQLEMREIDLDDQG